MRSGWRGATLLHVCTLLWGTQHAVIKYSVSVPPQSHRTAGKGERDNTTINGASTTLWNNTKGWDVDGDLAASKHSVALVALRFGLAALLFGCIALLSQACGATSSTQTATNGAHPTRGLKTPPRGSGSASGGVVGCGVLGALGWSVIAGCELGVWSFVGFALQAVGLLTTTASRSAFLLYLNVKMVPVLQICLDRRIAPARTWLSAALALTGTCLIVSDEAGPPTVGDGWCAAAAVASAVFIVRLGHHAKGTDPSVITAVSTAVCAGLGFAAIVFLNLTTPSCGISGFDPPTPPAQRATAAKGDDGGALGPWGQCGLGALRATLNELSNAWEGQAAAVIYLGLVPTGLCSYLQAVGQRSVPAEKASLIYALDPLYAALVAYLTLGERLYFWGLVGGGFIVAGIVVSTSSTSQHGTRGTNPVRPVAAV